MRYDMRKQDEKSTGMFDTTSPHGRVRRRFGLTEAVLVVAILAFGGFAMVTDGRQSFSSLLAGYDQAIGR
jgi:hypothetical protein